VGLQVLLSLMIFAALWGCAPKKVVRNPVQTQPPAPQAKRPDPVQAKEPMPFPEAHGKVEEHVSQDPVGDLTLGLKAATLAKEQLDKPYQWGAMGPEKFDCSGLVYYVFGALDVPLPRVSRDQAKKGRLVKKSELQPGDLVFFKTTGKIINHVGIYMGNSRFIHAPRRYSPVRYDSLNNSWWRQRFQFGRRIQG
jgi:cell wall-associated NlpC family hydrolase